MTTETQIAELVQATTALTAASVIKKAQLDAAVAAATGGAINGPITPTTVTATGAVSGSNLTGTNTGDETAATIKAKLNISNLSGNNSGDQIIPTTLPASDVYAWAKSATKPAYTLTELGAQAAGNYSTGGGTATGNNTGDQVASSTAPAAPGVAAVGSATTFARGDHVHQLQTSVSVLKNATTLVDGSAAAAPLVGQVYTATSPTVAEWKTPAASASGNAPVTLTASTNLTAALHANRTIYADSTAAITLTIQTGGWVDGDTVYVVAKNLTTGTISLADLLGAIKPNYQPQMNSSGQCLKVRFDSVTSKWQSMETPVFQASGATSTVAVASGGATLHYSMNGYSDIKFQTSNIQIQAGNSGYNGAPVDCRIFAQSTVTNARSAAQVTAGAQNYSHCRIGTETTYYEDSRRVSMYLHTTPIPNVETIFPNATETGERNRFIVSGGQGLIIGSDSGNSYNGKWSQYDTWGNASFLRSWGNASRQKDTVTTGTVTIGMGVTNLILAGSGTVTVALPATPYDGQIASLQIRTAYTGITVSGNGMSIGGSVVSPSAGGFASWRFDSTDSIWDRMS